MGHKSNFYLLFQSSNGRSKKIRRGMLPRSTEAILSLKSLLCSSSDVRPMTMSKLSFLIIQTRKLRHGKQDEYFTATQVGLLGVSHLPSWTVIVHPLPRRLPTCISSVGMIGTGILEMNLAMPSRSKIFSAAWSDRLADWIARSERDKVPLKDERNNEEMLPTGTDPY